jgi:hypothetical protein
MTGNYLPLSGKKGKKSRRQHKSCNLSAGAQLARKQFYSFYNLI